MWKLQVLLLKKVEILHDADKEKKAGEQENGDSFEVTLFLILNSI